MRLQAVCGPGRPYRSIGHFLVRATEKALSEAGKASVTQKPYDYEFAPRNDTEWAWTYGLMRYLRHHTKSSYPALRQLLAEVFHLKLS